MGMAMDYSKFFIGAHRPLLDLEDRRPLIRASFAVPQRLAGDWSVRGIKGGFICRGTRFTFTNFGISEWELIELRKVEGWRFGLNEPVYEVTLEEWRTDDEVLGRWRITMRSGLTPGRN